MKRIITLTIVVLSISCSSQKNLTFLSEDIERIEIFQGFPGDEIQMSKGFEKYFINDLNKSSGFSPTKYRITHLILIHYKTKNTDTIYTNGSIHSFKGYYKSDENLIKKYSLN